MRNTIKISLLLLITAITGCIELGYNSESEIYNIPPDAIDTIRVKANKVFKTDPFDEMTIYFLTYSYRFSKRINNGQDSIQSFFENLINKYPDKPKPLILRAKYEKKEFSLTDTSKLIYLKKAYALNNRNKEVNYLLGSLYYSLFIEQYRKSPANPIINYYADCTVNYFYNSFHLDKNTIIITKYPMIQTLNFLKRVDKVKEIESFQLDSSNFYLPFDWNNKLPKEWQTNYSLDIFSDFKIPYSAKGYSSSLRAMIEPIIYNREDKKLIFRFTWLRSFDNPIIIRIEKENDRIFLYWKMCEQWDGFFHGGELLVDKKKELNEKEWQNFISLIKIINFWQMPRDQNYGNGLDGATWILEGKENKNYHVVYRWSPNEESDFNKCCSYLIDLTQMEIKHKY